MSEQDGKTSVEVVKMTDGREVDFAGERKMVREALDTEDGSLQVRVDFRNGQTRTLAVPSSMIEDFAAYGALQRVSNETSVAKTIDEYVSKIDALIARVADGKISPRGEGGSGNLSILARALVEHTGKSHEQVREFLAGKTMAQKFALRDDPAVAPIVARLEAEKAAHVKAKPATVDTGALLAELA